MTTGVVRSMAASLTDQQKRDVAENLGGRKLDSRDVGAAKNMPNACSSNPPIRDLNGPSWNSWGVDNANSRFQSEKGANLSAGEGADQQRDRKSS